MSNAFQHPTHSPPPERRKVYEKNDLVRQLRELGVNDGDLLLVRVDFLTMGRIQRPADRILIESLLEAVGRHGTIVALTHSPVVLLFRRSKSYIYQPSTAPCVTGRFAQTVLQWEGVYRSLHPTCSMAAIGSLARDLLADHDHRSTCFGPIKGLLQGAGKMLLIGCTVSSPGFSTVHYTYEELGLANKSLLSGWIGSYYHNNGKIEWFPQRDVPGCSMGFQKFYPLYQEQSILRTGIVGNAEAYLILAADAYYLERDAIRKNPRFSLCDNYRCFSCRGTKLYNITDMPLYYLNCLPKKIAKLVLGR